MTQRHRAPFTRTSARKDTPCALKGCRMVNTCALLALRNSNAQPSRAPFLFARSPPADRQAPRRRCLI